MRYNLFLLDLDDTLLDFRASEKLSFFLAMNSLRLGEKSDEIFVDYQTINAELWGQFERGEITKDSLKIERFRRAFELHKVEIDPEIASLRYLDALPETVVLVDGAIELCQELSVYGEIGIVTNGVEYTQNQRIKRSGLAEYLNFIAVSEQCRYAKPDRRFFEFAITKVKKFSKEKTVVVGDRLETDILGALNFGVDSCWFNPLGQIPKLEIVPNYEVSSLTQIKKILLQCTS